MVSDGAASEVTEDNKYYFPAEELCVFPLFPWNKTLTLPFSTAHSIFSLLRSRFQGFLVI